MKQLRLLLLFAITGFTSEAQDFAPLGATWYYTEYYVTGPGIDYIKFEVVKDTIIQNVPCRKITKRHNLFCYNRYENQEFIHVADGTVLYYDSYFQSFQQLYDFYAQPGDNWYIQMYCNFSHETDSIHIRIDSTDLVNINGQTLKRQHVTYVLLHGLFGVDHTYHSTVVELLGDLHFMFNIFTKIKFTCDDNESGGLRCYDDTFLGHYETGIADSCNYAGVGIEETGGNNASFLLYPNPVNEIIHLKCNSNCPESYRIFDFTGRMISSGGISGKQIDTRTLKGGVYLVSFYDGHTNRLGSRRFVKAG